MLAANLRTIRGRLGLNVVLTVVALVAIAVAVLWMVRGQILQDRRDKVHSIVEMAAGVMAELEKQVAAGKLTRDQAMAQFASIDEGLRFDGGNYVAVYDLEGTVRAFPGGAKLVGVNRIDLTDPYGVKIVRAALDIANGPGEGFYEYHYPKPGETANPAAKLSFVKGFAPWGVYLISGIYIDDVDATVLRFALTFGAMALPLILVIAGFTLSLRRSVGSGLGRLSASLEIAAGDLDVSVEGRGRSTRSARWPRRSRRSRGRPWRSAA